MAQEDRTIRAAELEARFEVYGCSSQAERTTRLEEQMKTVYNQVERIEDKLDKLIDQGQERQVTIAENSVQIGNGERFLWLLISAVVGLVIYWIKVI